MAGGGRVQITDRDGRAMSSVARVVDGRLLVDSGGGGGGSDVNIAEVGGNAVGTEVPVNDGGGSLTVDGTVDVGNLPAVQSVDDNGGSLTVDGTVDVGNLPAVQSVDDNGGSLTVDGTVNVSNLPPSIGGGLPILLADSPSIDAFDRLRVSNPQGLFESTLTYDKQPLLWNEDLTGGATSTHLPNESAVAMVVTSSGDAVVRQARDYFRYQPGKSQLIFLTFNFGAGDANVRKRIGFFDDNNGIYLEEINGTLAFSIRSFTSGAVVEDRVVQANWNLNTFGSLDPTKAQICIIDYEWLGVGRVRVGFVIDGIVTYAHEFLHANIDDTVYMSSGQLPVRLETVATGAPGAANTFLGICCSVISEGGQEEDIGFPFSIGMSAPKATSGTRDPVLSIRPKATFNGLTNHVQIIQRQVEVFNAGNGVAFVELIYNGTLTGASFASVDASSVVEYDTAASAISGGIVVLSFYVGATNQSKVSVQTSITGRLPLTLDIAGANPTPLTVCVTEIGSVSAYASMNWQEYR